jgi:hypothetical protein
VQSAYPQFLGSLPLLLIGLAACRLQLSLDGLPEAAYQPKVQRAYVVHTGEEPRKVAMERARQQYLADNIADLLDEAGLPPSALVPGGGFPAAVAAGGDGDTTSAFLPLEIFDNTEYDPRTPAEWLALGVDPATKALLGVPAVALLPPQPHWAPVVVLTFDAATALYTVAERAVPGQTHGVPRVHLQFVAEDPRRFAQRVAEAVDRRRLAEARLYTRLAADSLPLDGLPPLPADALARIVPRALAGTAFRARDPLVARLAADLARNYARAHAPALLQAALASVGAVPGEATATAMTTAVVAGLAAAEVDDQYDLAVVPAHVPREPLFAETRLAVQALTFLNQQEVRAT